MKISHNELHVTLMKVLEAFGYPYGAEDEAAYMVSMSELYGLDGVNRFYQRMNEIAEKGFPENIDTTPKPEGATVNANGFSVLALAPGIIDLALAQLQTNASNYYVLIQNCQDADFILPLLLKPRAQNYEATFNWADAGKCFAFHKSMDLSASQLCQVGSDENQNSVCSIHFSIDDGVNPHQVNDDNRLKTVAQMEVTVNEKVATGISVNATMWKTIKKTYLPILVPETEESRQRGAGGGSANE